MERFLQQGMTERANLAQTQQDLDTLVRSIALPSA
jgi:hypothetical protein